MSGVLIDTSVWVAHFREHNPALEQLLLQDLALAHPLVVGELACGTPPRRMQTLQDLQSLRQAQQATVAQALGLIEQQRLYGQGCGLVDVLLLASTLMTEGARIWTLDHKLAKLAKTQGVLHIPQKH
ncbi:PIN domain-containing protein [Allofranklinella schreckenbergeri]|uniref:PIN domain-containing protein n=1 Tax=Allofranklinella schreckenbergeri TaxID=1076744 RepID=A0A3M6R669_9BURK|nr:PIN domain-containing protein [Allofranklinella schreckenbergeri]RMX10208.1 PIN domain-containing protein [Allofranklinella schreckenbergeri]